MQQLSIFMGNINQVLGMLLQVVVDVTTLFSAPWYEQDPNWNSGYPINATTSCYGR